MITLSGASAITGNVAGAPVRVDMARTARSHLDGAPPESGAFSSVAYVTTTPPCDDPEVASSSPWKISRDVGAILGDGGQVVPMNYDPYTPEVGQQYEYHEGGYMAVVTILEDRSEPKYRAWLVRVDRPIGPWPSDDATFEYGYATEYGYRPGEFWPLDTGNPFQPPEVRREIAKWMR